MLHWYNCNKAGCLERIWPLRIQYRWTLIICRGSIPGIVMHAKFQMNLYGQLSSECNWSQLHPGAVLRSSEVSDILYWPEKGFLVSRSASLRLLVDLLSPPIALEMLGALLLSRLEPLLRPVEVSE